jgi:hypothetical protein
MDDFQLCVQGDGHAGKLAAASCSLPLFITFKDVAKGVILFVCQKKKEGAHISVVYLETQRDATETTARLEVLPSNGNLQT